jgi:hypothetical protein
VLTRPLNRRIAQSSDADMTWQPALDGTLHKIRCKECERDCLSSMAPWITPRVVGTAKNLSSKVQEGLGRASDGPSADFCNIIGT